MIIFITKQLKSSNNKNFEFVKNRARIYRLGLIWLKRKRKKD